MFPPISSMEQLTSGGDQQTAAICVGYKQRASDMQQKLAQCALPCCAGYFDAPAAKVAPLGHAAQSNTLQLPAITLAFCCMDGLKFMKVGATPSHGGSAGRPDCTERPRLDAGVSLQASNLMAADQALTLYTDVVRRLLRVTEGYECQEAEGQFMLAFHQSIHAAQFCMMVRTGLTVYCPPCRADGACTAGDLFSNHPVCTQPGGSTTRHYQPTAAICLQVQEAMLKVQWGPDILSLHACGAEMSGDALVWQGRHDQ